MQAEPVSLYLDLLKRSLTACGNEVELHPLENVRPNWKTWMLYPLSRVLNTRNFTIAKVKKINAEERLNGYDWPAQAETMIGVGRLNNIQQCLEQILRDQVPGDLMETGIWRGGALIFMRGFLKAYGISDRRVFGADSFRGLPPPDLSHYPADKGSRLHKHKLLSVSLEEVKRNFSKYGLLDEQVCFLEGWFRDTLPTAPVHKLALLRLDGDMYGSTMEALSCLYPKLSPGGFVIVDDYNAFKACRQATDDYRKANAIGDAIQEIDKQAVFWRKRL